MVGSFVRFFFTRCEESLNSLVRCAHSFVRASRNSWRKIVRTHQPWSNLYITDFWTILIRQITYKTDNKFNGRNTLKLNSLSHKMLNLHIFPHFVWYVYYKKLCKRALWRTLWTLRDLLANLFGCSSPVGRGAFSCKMSLLLFAEAGVTPVGDLTLTRLEFKYFLTKAT